MYKRAKRYAYRRSAFTRRPAVGINLLAKRRYVGVASKGLTNSAPMFPSRPTEELGTYDVSGTATASTTGVLSLLHVPTRTGNTYQDRHGDATIIKTIRLKFTIKGGSSVAGNASGMQWVRCVLFWDNQPNGAVPGGALPFAALTINALTDPQYSYRFKILHDEQFCIAGGVGTTASSVSKETCDKSDFFKGNLNLVSNYSGNAGTIADITTGALYFYVIGDNAAVTNENPVVTFYSRTRFVP